MKKTVAIIGGGTAGMLLAAFMDTVIFDVTIYEQKSNLGRKFLVAGDGGFNLTHSEALPDFKARYTPLHYLDQALDHFSNNDFREWLLGIGIPTFVGSSGRVFPEKGIKPIAVLKAIETHLIAKKVCFEFDKTFAGWTDEDAVLFSSGEVVKADYTIFAMGGASWKRTGSDGAWLDIFKDSGIATLPFQSSNCAFQIDWNCDFIQNHEGAPLKNIAITMGDKIQKGEAVCTQFGLEGNAIYALSPAIRAALSTNKEAKIFIDLKPTMEIESVYKKIASSSSSTISQALKQKLKLSAVQIALLKSVMTKEAFMDFKTLAQYIKLLPLIITDAAPIEEAISTSGGVSLDAVAGNFELKDKRNQFCIGEMLDWDAPTGGYLIQGCASSGVFLANYLNQQ